MLKAALLPQEEAKPDLECFWLANTRSSRGFYMRSTWKKFFFEISFFKFKLNIYNLFIKFSLFLFLSHFLSIYYYSWRFLLVLFPFCKLWFRYILYIRIVFPSCFFTQFLSLYSFLPNFQFMFPNIIGLLMLLFQRSQEKGKWFYIRFYFTYKNMRSKR